MIGELKLTHDEMALLLDVLAVDQRDLTREISSTDALRAKGELRKRERAITRLIERLRNEIEPAAMRRLN